MSFQSIKQSMKEIKEKIQLRNYSIALIKIPKKRLKKQMKTVELVPRRLNTKTKAT